METIVNMGYTVSNIQGIVDAQRTFFRKGTTLDVNWRLCQLHRLRDAPTIIYPVGADEQIVRQELFCPLLPVVPFVDKEVDSILDIIESREHPLAMYLFTKDMRWAEKVMRSHQYGGGCINEVCVHLMVKGVPFGGVGHSGMGAYHGEWGFREFTHPSTVLKGSTRFNLPLREHPYNGNRILPLLRHMEK